MSKADCTCGTQSREGSCRYCRDLFYKWSYKQRNREKIREADRQYARSLRGKITSRRSSLAYRHRNLEACRARDRKRPYRGQDDKARARDAVAKAKAKGLLTIQPCEVCGSDVRVEAHHDDYARPLDVVWLCDQHHKEIHWPLAA